MTLRTIQQFLIRNIRTGETDPRRWLSAQLAHEIARAKSGGARWGDWQVWSELSVLQPEPDAQ